ncbi:glycerol-3-phosphate dehydrogenase [soil metagenome]
MSSRLEARKHLMALAASTSADVIVVGGGINGAGIALDAASRGLRTVLLERDDLAVGTSSRSSKLIHGGLRYLEHLQFGLVREALAERHLLSTRLAPHLVHIERFTVPVYGGRWQTPYLATGLALYDLLGGRKAGPFGHLSHSQALAEMPTLHRTGLRGAFQYSDGVFDDARLVVAAARSAATLGATILTRCEVLEPIRSGALVEGVRVFDRLSAEHVEMKARVVIDATGVFDFEPGAVNSLRPSRGTHLVIPRSKIPLKGGLTLRVPGRLVFVIPWGGNWLVGTTDVPHRGDKDRPTATREEVSYLLSSLAEFLDVRLTLNDILATFAGIRPLVGGGEDTSFLSREESIEEREPGLVTVRGGKYTTYRRVAQRAVDFTSSRLGEIPPSPTKWLPLVGAAAPGVLSRLGEELGPATSLDDSIGQHLVARFGREAFEVASIAASADMAEPLVRGLPYLRAEAAWAIKREYALSIDDVLARRSRIAIEDPNHGMSAAGFVAGLLAKELGWGPDEQADAVEEYRKSSAIEYGVPGRVMQGAVK